MAQKKATDELTVNQVLETIRSITVTGIQKTISVHPSKAMNCILANDTVARRDIPLFDNSAMDGFVFRKEDLEKGQTRFPVVNEVRPENKNPAPIEPGTCARIMTGAPIPGNGSQVIPVELVNETISEVEVLKIPEKNPIRKQGEGYRAGETILAKGSVIRPYEAGLLIESGNTDCVLKKPLRVSLQVTGSELNELNNTNGPVLELILSHWPGVEVQRLPVLNDNAELVRNRIYELREMSDVVITTGGISAGKHDYIYDTMKQMKANILVRKVKQKPGKPFTLSMVGNIPFIHLPGNPVSALFCAEMYAKTLIYHLQGIFFSTHVAEARSVLENTSHDKTLFLPGKLIVSNTGKLTVTADTRMRSHLLQLYSGNNVYIRLEPGTYYKPGDIVPVIPFTSTLLP